MRNAPKTVLPETATPEFRKLAETYMSMPVYYAHLRSVTYAQWALESGWGASGLARTHKNYAGMKWRRAMEPFATKVLYKAWDGWAEYCSFKTDQAFILGYWTRLNAIPAYNGWQTHAETPESFMKFIGPIWVGGAKGMKPGTNYVRDVMRIQKRVAPMFEDQHAQDTNGPSPTDGHYPWGRMRGDDEFT